MTHSTAAASCSMGSAQYVPQLEPAVRGLPPDFIRALFGPYKQYYHSDFAFPIDRLRSLGKGELVIQPSRVSPNRFLAIFNSRSGVPYIKSFGADKEGITCDKTRYASFGVFLEHYNADVVVENRTYSFPFAMTAIPVHQRIPSGDFPTLAMLFPPTVQAMGLPPQPPKRQLLPQYRGNIIPIGVQQQVLPASSSEGQASLLPPSEEKARGARQLLFHKRGRK